MIMLKCIDLYCVIERGVESEVSRHFYNAR